MNSWLHDRRLTIVGRFALLMLVIDIVVAGAMLAILREPIPVFATFATLYAASVVFLRGKALTEPRQKA
jgi:hypothetical protein